MLTNVQATFETIQKYWMKEIESYADRNVKLLLLGNKNDLKNEKQVDTKVAEVLFHFDGFVFLQLQQQFARNNNMEFYEVSAKTAESVSDGFVSVAKKLIQEK